MPDEPETIEYKGRVVGKVGGCSLIVTTDATGKKHFEGTCLTKEDRDELAALFDEEAILRINPKAILEEPPVGEPPVTEEPSSIQGKTTLPGYKYLDHLDISVKE